MSKQRRGGLGRGLGALIPTAPPPEADDSAPEHGPPAGSGDGATGVPERAQAATTSAGEDQGGAQLASVPGASFAELPIADIRANPKQPRQVFDEDALAELAHSIREFGVLQPVVVRPVAEPNAEPNAEPGAAARWELVMGERRLRAAALAGLDSIPAIIRSTGDDEMLRDALLENVHRSQLNPLEEAAAYQQLLEEFGATHDELASRLGRSRPQVTNTVRLLNLSLPVQRRVAAGVLSAGHARALLTLDDANAQDELASRIVAEGLSVRATEELVAVSRRTRADTGASRRRARSTRITAPAVEELAGKLSDVFDTRVRVDIGRRKGRITVEFASIDDLERIVGVMAPQLATTRTPTDDSVGDRADGQDDAKLP